MLYGCRVWAGTAWALAILLIAFGAGGAARAGGGREFVSADQEYRLSLAEGWIALQGEPAKNAAKSYVKVLPGLDKSLDKLTALLQRDPRVGGTVLFDPYPASARAQGVASFWNKYVSHLRSLDRRYGGKELKGEQGYAGRTPYFRQIGPEPKQGLFLFTSRYRRWEGVLIFKFFCPLDLKDQCLPQFRAMADSIEFAEPKVKSKHRGY